MICGNEPFIYFPYRNSSQLTAFFANIDLDYIHDGSTRVTWVQRILFEINNRDSNPSDEIISFEMCAIIEQLLSPDYYLFNEDDYVDFNKAKESVIGILKLNNLTVVEQRNGTFKVSSLYSDFISTDVNIAQHDRIITFSPSVFNIPDKGQSNELISVMMPFSAGFSQTYTAIKDVAKHMKLDCKRADDIWNHSTIIQDIFELIYCAKVVVVDFTGRNPNVMYETGIAHTLGKMVIPITQSIDDIPSDIGHHRALQYYPNEQGYRDLKNELYKRLKDVFNG